MFIWASLYTFIGNYSILGYLNILFILELNSEFRDFKLWDQKLLFTCHVFLLENLYPTFPTITSGVLYFHVFLMIETIKLCPDANKMMLCYAIK